MEPAYKYWAFISYSHRDNAGEGNRWADWLHEQLERFAVPSPLVGRTGRHGEPVPARLYPVFQDEKELPANANLGETIREALRQSRHLVVICSPRATQSAYVNEEVLEFKRLGRGDRILAIIVAGEPGATRPGRGLDPALEAFPEALRHPLGAEGDLDRTRPAEPIAADVRGADGREISLRDEAQSGLLEREKLRVIAGLLGVGFDDLVQRDKEQQLAAERRRTRRLRKLVAAFALIGLVAVTAAGVAWQQRNARARALADVLRLSDSKQVRDLVDEVDQLWPLQPDRATSMADWIERARAILRNRAGHEATLLRLRTQARPRRTSEPWVFANAELDWQHSVVTNLLAGLDRIEDARDPGRGLLREVARRHEFVTTLRRHSLEEPAGAWARAIAAIKDETQSPAYRGLALAPQLGLVPLGPDPASHLHEFAQLGTGPIPSRDPATGQLVQAEDAAIVLVLIPSVTFLMGAQRSSPGGLHYDPAAQADESPVHEVALSAFFLAKYECTQAQWATLTGGEDPSQYKAGQVVQGFTLTRRNPVEQVSWDEGRRWAERHGLALPTEAQWEGAARAGTDTPWSTGPDVARLSGAANIADAFLATHGGPANWQFTLEVNDGHYGHAPVGSFAPNAWGLHDMLGNVYEWCRDVYAPYAATTQRDPTGPPQDEPGAVRVGRGGSWSDAAPGARVSPRTRDGPGTRNDSLGVRFARPVWP